MTHYMNKKHKQTNKKQTKNKTKTKTKKKQQQQPQQQQIPPKQNKTKQNKTKTKEKQTNKQTKWIIVITWPTSGLDPGFAKRGGRVSKLRGGGIDWYRLKISWICMKGGSDRPIPASAHAHEGKKKKKKTD